MRVLVCLAVCAVDYFDEQRRVNEHDALHLQNVPSNFQVSLLVALYALNMPVLAVCIFGPLSMVTNVFWWSIPAGDICAFSMY